MLEFLSLPNHDFLEKISKKNLEFNLSDACTDALSIKEICAMHKSPMSALAKLTDMNLSYSSIQGEDDLREEIARMYSDLHEMPIAQVSIFSGAQEAFFLAMQAILSKDDEVITITPCYPTLKLVPQTLGITVQEIQLCEEQQWNLDINLVEQAISSKTKAIIINSPNNPTGSRIDANTMKRLISICASQDIYLVSDEVSILTQHSTGKSVTPSGVHSYKKGIVINVTSKSFGLAGIRVGWLVSQDLALHKKITLGKSYLSICGSRIDSAVATLAIQYRDKILHERQNTILKNKDLFQTLVDSYPDKLSWVPPAAGLLAVVKIRLQHDRNNPNENIDRFCWEFATQEHTLLLPGHIFGLEGNYFRLGLGKSTFSTALRKFEKFLVETPSHPSNDA